MVRNLEGNNNRQLYKDKAILRQGETRVNNYGSPMTIDQYNSSSSIWVRFLDSGYPVHTSYQAFQSGSVKNPYDKSVYGEGYIGEGKYRTTINGQSTPQYKVWSSMLARCYSTKLQEKNPTYNGVTVCDEWKNFQTFAAWYDENYYEIDGQRTDLDKDVLVKGNKVYSPDTCVFVPHIINTLFISCDGLRGDLPVGVNFHKASNKFITKCRNGKGIRTHLGLYDNPEEAFLVYQEFKYNIIKDVAEQYKDVIPTKLYDAMLNYKIEMND